MCNRLKDPLLQVVQPTYVEVDMSLLAFLLDVARARSIMYDICELCGEDGVPC